MRRLIQTTALCLALAAPASADIVYQGRDAQGLHCAAMLAVVSITLHEAGALSDQDYKLSAIAAAAIMLQLPGTNPEKGQALRQRAEKIIKTRSLDQLAHEFSSTTKWCKREFLS